MKYVLAALELIVFAFLGMMASGVLGIVGTCVAVGVAAGLWALVRASCQNSVL